MKNRIRMVAPDGSRFNMTDPWVGLLHSRIQGKIEDAIPADEAICAFYDLTPIDSILTDTTFFDEVADLIRFGVWDYIKEMNDGN